MMKYFDSEYVDKGVANVVSTHSVFRKNVTFDNKKSHINQCHTLSLENSVSKKQSRGVKLIPFHHFF